MKNFRFAWMPLLLVASLALTGCGAEKKAAESAVAAAETAFNAAKDNLNAVMPDDTKAIEDSIAQAKAALETGDYKGALAAVKDVPAKVGELTTQAVDKAAELKTTWDGLNTNLPGAVGAAQAQVDKLATMKKLPAGMDAAQLEGAKTSLATATTAWTEAQEAQAGGNWAMAVTKGTEAKTATVEAMNAIGMPVPDALK